MTIPQPPEDPQNQAQPPVPPVPPAPPVPPVPPVNDAPAAPAGEQSAPTSPASVPPVEPQASPYGTPQPDQAQYAQQQYAQQQYPQPGAPGADYGQQPGYPQAPQYGAPARPTEGLAIAGLITAIFFWPAGLIISPIALSKIKKNGNNGRGLAIAGIIVSAVLGLFSIISIIISIISIVAAASLAKTTIDNLPDYSDMDTVTTSVGVGELAETESGLGYTVNSLECGIGTVGADYLTVEPTGEFCKVDVTFINNSDEPAYFLSSDGTAFIGTSEYSADSSATSYAAYAEGDEDGAYLDQVNPGIEVSSDLYFDVPAGTQPDRIEFSSFSSFTDGIVEVTF